MFFSLWDRGDDDDDDDGVTSESIVWIVSPRGSVPVLSFPLVKLPEVVYKLLWLQVEDY